MKIILQRCTPILFFLGFEGDLIYPEVIWGNVDTYLRAF